MRASSSNARRRRGRPPRLSREGILDTGLALLEREPAEPLTLVRVASEVGSVPAALYRHIRNHDDLLDGVVGLVLEGIQLEIRTDDPWPDQVREWAESVRAHLLRYPGVVLLISRRGRTSPAWLEVTAVLTEILSRSGLRGSALASTCIWVAEMVTGFVLQECCLSLGGQIEAARASLDSLSERAHRTLAPMLEDMATVEPDAHFDFVVERTLAGLVTFAANPPASARGRSHTPDR